jgi:hypothetical protein
LRPLGAKKDLRLTDFRASHFVFIHSNQKKRDGSELSFPWRRGKGAVSRSSKLASLPFQTARNREEYAAEIRFIIV